jgi:hypothetical protein
MLETACVYNRSGHLVGDNKIVYQIMSGMSNNNINNGIGGAFVFLVIFKCLPFFLYQHTEMLVSQVKEFLLLKPLVIVIYTIIVWCSDV